MTRLKLSMIINIMLPSKIIMAIITGPRNCRMLSLGLRCPSILGALISVTIFPRKASFLIDINDVEGVSEIIKRAIHDKEYEKRLPFILEARRRVMEQYNMFSVLTREIESRMNGSETLPSRGLLLFSQIAA